MNASSLIEKHLNAALTPDEAAALALALAENPALADEFAAATRMECELRGAMKDDAHTALYTRRMERAAAEVEPVVRRRGWVRPMAAAAAIALLAGVGMAFLDARQKETAQQPKPSSIGGGKISLPGEFAALPGGETARTDVAAMKRKLRRFAASSAMLRGVPVSQALASLESQWKGYAHRDAKDRDAVSFTLADAARKLWAKPEDEPSVSLEIPGISLLTSVEVIAAQAGLRAKVTGAGISLEPERQNDGKPRTWTLPLASATFGSFLTRAQQEMVQSNLHVGFSLLPLINAGKPSWMEPATPASTFQITTALASVLAREEMQVRDDSDVVYSVKPNSIDSLLQAIAEEALTGIPGEIAAEYSGIEVLNADGGLVAAASTPAYDLTSTQSIDELIGVSGNSSGRIFVGREFSYPTEFDPPQIPQTTVEAEVNSEDGYTIDLNLAPEVVEFDGFINYGSPVQASDEIILTDSGITQPVFATRYLNDHSGSLTRLLAAHGAQAANLKWDEETGTVTARGPLRELRAASAALAAVRESAGAGAVFKVKILEWGDTTAVPAPETNGLATGTEVARLSKQAKDVLDLPSATTLLGHPVRLVSGGLASSTENLPDGQQLPGGFFIDIKSAVPHGASWTVDANFMRAGEISSDSGGGVNISDIQSREQPARLAEGEWLRVDYMASREAKAATILLRVEPATLP